MARKAETKADKAADAGVQRAQDALDAGQAAAAAALQVPTTAAPKAVGSAAKSTWSGKVTDLKKLVIGVAAPFLLEEFNRGGVEGLLQALRQAGTAPITMLEANQTNLNKVATALKNELNYPGVEPVETKGLAISARK